MPEVITTVFPEAEYDKELYAEVEYGLTLLYMTSNA